MTELIHHWLKEYKKHTVLLKMSLQSGMMGIFDKAFQVFPSYGTSLGEGERTRFKSNRRKCSISCEQKLYKRR